MKSIPSSEGVSRAWWRARPRLDRSGLDLFATIVSKIAPLGLANIPKGAPIRPSSQWPPWQGSPVPAPTRPGRSLPDGSGTESCDGGKRASPGAAASCILPARPLHIWCSRSRSAMDDDKLMTTHCARQECTCLRLEAVLWWRPLGRMK